MKIFYKSLAFLLIIILSLTYTPETNYAALGVGDPVAGKIQAIISMSTKCNVNATAGNTPFVTGNVYPGAGVWLWTTVSRPYGYGVKPILGKNILGLSLSPGVCWHLDTTTEVLTTISLNMKIVKFGGFNQI